MKAVFGLASNADQAHKAIDQLIKIGFKNGDISILYPDKDNQLKGKYKSFFSDDKLDSKSNKNSIHTNGKTKEDWNGESNSSFDRTTENHRNQDEFSTNNKKKHGSLATEASTKAPEGGVTGASAGGVIGGTLGLLAGIGALAIPGLGPFIAAGPIMAALSGSAVGGGVGLLLGAIVGYGIPEYEAKRYEEGVKAGKILISVRAANDNQVSDAKELLKKIGLTDISSSSEIAKAKH